MRFSNFDRFHACSKTHCAGLGVLSGKDVYVFTFDVVDSRTFEEVEYRCD